MKRTQVKKERQPSFSQSGPKAATGEGCSGIRRKLTYKSKLPLEGKKIYLDLRGVKLRNVEDSLTTFGAIIEKFLSKEIHYFVTDNPKAKEKNDDTSVSGSTSLCISSPFNSGQTPSPSTFDKKAVSVTRGRAMLQCVKLDSSHENIVDKAKKLGVKVVSYTNLIKWLNKEKPLLESTKAACAAPASRPKTEDNQKKKKIKLKHLRRPFIKFEALNKHYRPVVMEFISWPHINLAPSSSACPFDEWLGCVSPTKPKPVNKEPQLPSVWSAESANPQNASNVIENKDPQQEDNNDDDAKKCDEHQRSVSEKLLKRRLSNWERRRLAEKKQKQGFCECCDVRFDDIKKHLISAEHCAFMTNKTNYERLDRLISQGFTMQQFVENIEAGLPNRSSNNSNQDYEFSEPSNKVLLLSSLKNPSAVLPKASRLSEIHCSPPVPVAHSMSPSNASLGNDAKAKGASSVQQSNTVLPRLEKPSTPSKKSGLRIPANSSWKSPPRSPFKCLFNSPSRLDVIHSDNDNISKSPINSRATTKEHSAIALKLKEPSPQNRLLSPLRNAMPVDNSISCKSLKNSGKQTHKPLENCLPLPPPPLPPLGSFPGPKCSKTPKDIECEASLSEQNPKGLDVLPSNVCRYLSPPVLEKWDTLAVNQSTKSSPEAITPGMHVKRSFSSSSNKKSRTKRQRLFKLGEKWQVLSQQSVKKILFNDESPESFIGFQPQDISKTDYSSNISFEIVSEVLLTDHSDFEWTLGNSESSSQTADAHHQTLSPKDAPTQEDTVPQSPNLLKKCPLTVNNATCANSLAESDTELNPTAVPCMSHPLDTTTPDQPEEEVCDQSVGFVSSNHNHNTPAALPVQGFTIPLIQDIQFPTNLSFENLDTVASTVCNFNSAESCISAQRTSTVPTDTHNTQSSPDMDSVSNSTSAIRSVELLQNLPPLLSREDSQITSIPSMYEQAFPSNDPSISIDNHTRKNSQSLSPSVGTVQEPETPVAESFQSQDCETSPESGAVYDALPVLNFESSFNLPVQNIEMLSGIVTSNEDTAQLSSEPTALNTAGDNSMLISPELPPQSRYNTPAQEAEPNNNDNNNDDDDEHLVVTADTAPIPLPECMSDNEELTGNDSNMEQQQKQVLIQMAELATSSCSSGQYDSSSSSELNPLTSEQQTSSVAGFVSLSNLATSRDEKCGIRSVSHNFRIQPFNISHPAGSSLNSEKPATHDHKLSRNSNRFDHDCQDSKQSLVRSPGPDHLTDCGFLSRYKSSHCSCSSSSDIQASNSASASSKSESEITDPLVKSITDNTEAPSDETMITSDWNVKDSGFLSVEELTPKKSPPLPDNKKIVALAKPCSVVLEKTDLLVPGFINKSNNKQNVFSVKRTSGTVDKTPETVVKPRLLKRLSDTRKTFRLDYIHSNSSGRKSSPHAFAFFKSRCK